jgi:hypothetical protein
LIQNHPQGKEPEIKAGTERGGGGRQEQEDLIIDDLINKHTFDRNLLKILPKRQIITPARGSFHADCQNRGNDSDNDNDAD